jgi:hypothetical protein
MEYSSIELLERDADIRKLLTTHQRTGKLMMPEKNTLDHITITDFLDTKKKLKEKFIEAQPKIFQEILELMSEQSKIRIKINLADYDNVERNNDVIGLMKIIKATHTQALTEMSFIDQQSISDMMSQIKQGNKEITVYNDEYAALYDRYVKAELPVLTPPQIISRYVMSLNENFHREKTSIVKAADKMISYYQKLISDASFTQRMYDREREKNDEFPLDLPDAMQKMVNAELINKAVKPATQFSKPLTIPHEGLAFQMTDNFNNCGCLNNCIFCHASSHCTCKCEKLKAFMTNNKPAYQAAIQRKPNLQGRGGGKGNYSGRSGAGKGGKSQHTQGRGSWGNNNNPQERTGSKGSSRLHDSTPYRGVDIFRNSSGKGGGGSKGGRGTARTNTYGKGQTNYQHSYQQNHRASNNTSTVRMAHAMLDRVREKYDDNENQFYEHEYDEYEKQHFPNSDMNDYNYDYYDHDYTDATDYENSINGK